MIPPHISIIHQNNHQRYKQYNLMFGKINFPSKSPNNNKEHQPQATNSLFQNREKNFPPKNKKIVKEEKQKQLVHQNLGEKFQKYEKKGLKKKEKSIKIEKDALREQLQGSKFRLLNEFLYTTDSKNALDHFKENEEDFNVYHQGFRNQAMKWEVNPLDVIIGYIYKHFVKVKKVKNSKKKLILDLGCGDGRLQEDLIVKQEELKAVCLNIRSFDLISAKPHVQVADIANLPIQDNSVDACVFCLSLMGTNYLDFIIEARRVLKKTEQALGELLIAQVQSRSSNWKSFVSMIQSLGFTCFRNQTVGAPEEPYSQQPQPQKSKKQKKNSDFFRVMYFRIDPYNKFEEVPNQARELSKHLLGSCMYKRR